MLHRGYDVWISDADGQRIPEYAVEVEGADGKTVACYIPSASGQRFIVNWRDYNGLHHTSLRTFVDGKPAGSSVCNPNEAGKRIGVRTSESLDTYSTYQFADLLTTDDENALWSNGSAFLEKVGTIEVHARRIHAKRKPATYHPTTFEGAGAVHERSKKLGAHCVTLGEPVKMKHAGPRCKSKLLDPHEGPYATFIFRYRPAALLQAQGIMPPPEPAAAHNGKGKARAAPNDRLGKRASSSSQKTSGGRVKAEPDAASSSVRPTQSDVIELSDSDYDEMDRKPVIIRSIAPRGVRVKPERVKADPDDVIDLTLDS